MRSAALICCAALLAFPAAALGQADPDAQVAVKEGTMAWTAAFNAGNAANVAALYADDARLLPPGGETVEGMEAIEAFWQGFISEGSSVALEGVELYNLGDVALDIGAFTVTAADGSHADHGKYMVIWVKGDDGWKMVRDMWNSSMTP
jgi:uncharacterized protein (TIGR02246 family)